MRRPPSRRARLLLHCGPISQRNALIFAFLDLKPRCFNEVKDQLKKRRSCYEYWTLCVYRSSHNHTLHSTYHSKYQEQLTVKHDKRGMRAHVITLTSDLKTWCVGGGGVDRTTRSGCVPEQVWTGHRPETGTIPVNFPGVKATRTSGTGLERDRNTNRNRCEQGLIGDHAHFGWCDLQHSPCG